MGMWLLGRLCKTFRMYWNTSGRAAPRAIVFKKTHQDIKSAIGVCQMGQRDVVHITHTNLQGDEAGPSRKAAVAGVDNTARRQFDLEQFREQAAKRELEESELDGLTPYEVKQLKRRRRDPLHQGIIVKRDFLQGRDYKLDLAARLNKTQVISNNTPLNQQAGYYCAVCDCILRDSQSYLDHINGKYHNRALGMTMNVEKKGLDSVQARLAMHRETKEKQKREDYVPDGFEKRVKDVEERERIEKEERKAKKKAKRKEQQDQVLAITDGTEHDDAEAEMQAMLGFTGFGGK